MGAGASAAGMPIEQRRELYEDLRTKYTRNDLDALAAEEKQAWLEVLDEEREAEAQATVAEASAGVAAVVGDEVVAANERAAVATAASSGQRDLSITAPEVTVRQAAEAAAGLTGATSGRTSGWDLSGEGDTGVRPQEKSTRLSFLLASESNDNAGPSDEASGDAVRDVAADGSAARRCRQEPAKSKRGSVELPAWKKAAEELETPNELCIGDVVRARDKDFNGMWFEGVLTAIHDEATFEVELSSDEEEGVEGGSPQRITVGIEDVVRVMPWFCIEVGDMVECQPEGVVGWIRGTVVNVVLDLAMYDVALESCLDGGEDVRNVSGEDADGENGDDTTREQGEQVVEHHVHRVPDCRIRKIVSGRQAASRRWKKVGGRYK
ncbi:unnamed protein product [Scytosiphon promiscuus]